MKKCVIVPVVPQLAKERNRMLNLKRYKYTANVGGCETWYTMDENINGEYVKFEDIKNLLPTSHNSNYAAARDAHREWRANVCYYHGAVMNFEEWCEMCLNSDKPNCA